MKLYHRHRVVVTADRNVAVDLFDGGFWWREGLLVAVVGSWLRLREGVLVDDSGQVLAATVSNSAEPGGWED
ncbi:hypothetical protein TIFTF001_004325 [Ficus carica]|uniref:Uncharacterized protein n=1 Tax=Ficus carica TaxID=3494 RepID=A0AA88CXN5_FICCA|nr:hypothetical protein TIFTF001_004325 [Ficus carica]